MHCFHWSNTLPCDGTLLLHHCWVSLISPCLLFTYTSLQRRRETGSGSRRWWWRWSKAKRLVSMTKAAVIKGTHLSQEHGSVLTEYCNNHHHNEYTESLTGCLMMVSQFFQRRSLSCWKKAIPGGRGEGQQVSVGRKESHIHWKRRRRLITNWELNISFGLWGRSHVKMTI